MKLTRKISVFVFILLIVSCTNYDCINFKHIEFDKDTLAYYNNEPFTGIACEYDSNNKIIGKYHIKNGKLYFQCQFYMDDSSWMYSEIKNGLLHGRAETHWVDGSYTIGNYDNGYPDGVFKTFNQNGVLELVKTFKKGEITGIFKLFKNGKIIQEGKLVNNTVDSIWTYWQDSTPTYVLFNMGKEIGNLSRYIYLNELEDSSFPIEYLQNNDSVKLLIEMDSIYINSVRKITD